MEIEIQQILTQIAGFLVLLFLLKKFAWSQIFNLLDERKEKIKNEFLEIDRLKESVAQIRKDYETKLVEIEELSRRKIQDAISEGQRISAEIHEKARAESITLLEKTKENLSIEVAKARIELRNEISSLAIMAAEKIIQKELSGKDQEKIVVEFISNLNEFK